MQRAAEMGIEIIFPRHRNPPNRSSPDHWECWMNDPDGYVVVVASPMEQPMVTGALPLIYSPS